VDFLVVVFTQFLACFAWFKKETNIKLCN